MTTVVSNSRTDRKQLSVRLARATNCRQLVALGQTCNGVRTISRPHPVALAALDHVTVTLRVTVVALPQLSVTVKVIV